MSLDPVKSVGAVLLLCCMAHAGAGSISIFYAGQNEVSDSGKVLAAPGDVLIFGLVADFSDHPTLGGGFDLNFDPAVLEFDEIIRFDGYICKWHCDYPGAPDGRLESISIADFGGIVGPAIFAHVIFQFLGDDVTSSFVSLGPTDGIGGPFISFIDFVTILDVDYNAIEVGSVPIPAAAWLLLTGLAALLGYSHAPRPPTRQLIRTNGAGRLAQLNCG